MEDTLLAACRRELGLKISFISTDNMMNVFGILLYLDTFCNAKFVVTLLRDKEFVIVLEFYMF